MEEFYTRRESSLGSNRSNRYEYEDFVEQSEEEEELISLDPNKLTPQYHTQYAETALYKLKYLVRDPGWKKISQHRSGITIYTKHGTSDEDKLPVFMGEHIIKGFTPQAVFAVIGMRKLWDDWYDEGNLVENLDETTSLTYMVMKALAGSKARDLSLVEKIECAKNGTIYFVSTSVETPKVPRVFNRIRARINLNGWVLESLSSKPPQTKATYLLQADAKGWVPSVLSKSYLAKRPLILHNIDQYLQKNGPPTMVVTPPESVNRSGFSTIQNSVDLGEIKRPKKKTSAQLREGSSHSTRRSNKKFQNGYSPYLDTPSSISPLSMSPVLSPVYSPVFSHVEPLSPLATTKGFSSRQRSPVIQKQHRHTAVLQKAFKTFKSHISLDSWNLYFENKGLKIYTKEYDNRSTPIMRGEGVISGGFTTFDILSVIKNLDLRKFWDDRYEEGATYEMFSLHEHLVRTAMKGTFPISGRDMSICGMANYDKNTGVIQYICTSVVDSLIPESKKHVRAHLELAGWLLEPNFDSDGNTTSVHVTYIVDIDIKLDTIPSSICRMLSIQIPTIVAKMDELMQKIGFPPYILNSALKVIKEKLNIKNYHYELSLIAQGGGIIELKISKLMYPNGVDVSTIPENCKVELLSNNSETIRITLPSRVDLDTLIITITKLSKGFQMTHNRRQTIPIFLNSDINGKQSTSENATLVADEPIDHQVINDDFDLKDLKEMNVSYSKDAIMAETFVKPLEEPYQIIDKQTLFEDTNAEVARTPYEIQNRSSKTEKKSKEETVENIEELSSSDSLQFSMQHVGLMFASMLLAYYAGKLSIL